MKNKNEGTCGYGPGGKLGKTPGGTRGMPADKRTNDMLTLREFIREELKKITEHHEDEEFPKVGKGVGNLLDKMKGKDKALYNKVEKYIKKFIQQEFKMYKAIDSKGGETIFPDKDDTSALKKKQASNVMDVKPLEKP